MKNRRFWNWKKQTDAENAGERILEIYGAIAEEGWFDDDVTPKQFRDELFSGSGDVTIYINSPGGDCVAASQIYTMLMDYPGRVTVKIDGLAASAASVIAMAGAEVLMSPTALVMIHNPITGAYGSADDMRLAIEMLSEVKESIINAYEIKTGLSRAKISHYMDSETWMNANKAIELGFADGLIGDGMKSDVPAYAFLGSDVASVLVNKLAGRARAAAKAAEISALPDESKKSTEPQGRSVDDLMERLLLLKY